ncbi:hypothetical protein TNCV_2941071 [Trichonephila clavipes]|nr:hypothetical protein TNCV_2941071 [Trichonephila clavipes]
MNVMTSVFSKHESNRARLGHSRKTSCLPPNTPTNLQELERALLEEWDRITHSGLTASLTSCLKGAQRCWSSVEIIPLTENYFL